jgi:hypothetical protein
MRSKIFSLAAITAILISCGGQQSSDQTTTPAMETTPPAASEPPAATTPASVSFSKEVSYDNIRFQVNSPGTTTANNFTVTPSGLSASNDPITENIQGGVVDVLANDMDGDNSPEVAVIVEETPGGKRKAYVYSSFARKSFGMVNFVDVTDAAKLAGYQGGDEYEIMENTFVRRFPIYEGGKKTGKTRQFQFKMKAGEAMKQLVFDRQSDY